MSILDYNKQAQQIENARKHSSYRQVLGEKLREFRESRGLTVYAVAKNGGLEWSQVHSLERGDKNYTIDTFLGYIHGCDLYMFFGEKSNTSDSHDFDDLIKKLSENDPNR